MKSLDYMSVAEQMMKQIKKGAFLTVKAGSELNTMAIGWATIGFVWQKPIFMVAVRDSRHTYELIEKAKDFTVSIPTGNQHEAVMFCGTKSGRDYNKFKECGLTLIDGQSVVSPIINIPGIHLECRIVYKTAMDPSFMVEDFGKLYPEKDYHTLYFGEILECYECGS